MKILFLTLARIDSVEQKGIYQDLIRKIRDKGNEGKVFTIPHGD